MSAPRSAPAARAGKRNIRRSSPGPIVLSRSAVEAEGAWREFLAADAAHDKSLDEFEAGKKRLRDQLGLEDDISVWNAWRDLLQAAQREFETIPHGAEHRLVRSVLELDGKCNRLENERIRCGVHSAEEAGRLAGLRVDSLRGNILARAGTSIPNLVVALLVYLRSGGSKWSEDQETDDLVRLALGVLREHLTDDLANAVDAALLKEPASGLRPVRASVRILSGSARAVCMSGGLIAEWSVASTGISSGRATVKRTGSESSGLNPRLSRPSSEQTGRPTMTRGRVWRPPFMRRPSRRMRRLQGRAGGESAVRSLERAFPSAPSAGSPALHASASSNMRVAACLSRPTSRSARAVRSPRFAALSRRCGKPVIRSNHASSAPSASHAA